MNKNKRKTFHVSFIILFKNFEIGFNFFIDTAKRRKAMLIWFCNKKLLTFWKPATPSSQQQRAYFWVWTDGNPAYAPPLTLIR